MFALIQGKRVVQWSDPSFPVAQPLFWVQHDRVGAPDDCEYEGDDTIMLKPTPTPTPAEINKQISAKIGALEFAQHRAVRETVLGHGDTPDPKGTTPKQRLKAIDNAIIALRAQFVPE